MPFFLIQTLGCKLNQLESEAIADAFTQAGFEKLRIKEEFYHKWNLQFLHEQIKEKKNNKTEPKIIIINTCTVTSKADQKARRIIRKALIDYPEAAVIVTGCYAELNKDDILKLQTGAVNRLHVVNKKDIFSLPDFIKKSGIINDEFPSFDFSLPSSGLQFQFNPKRFSSHTRSFLKIQDGCDKNCTYCKIRLARGKSVSLEADEVLKRLRVLEENHAEVVLTGVNISQYKDQRREKNFTTNQHEQEEKNVFYLSELLDYLLAGTEKIAIRLSSLAPESIDEKLCAVLSHPRIRPHFHLSVQSCSDKILEKMGRGYSGETVKKAVELLRSVKNDPFIACDIITGFPGETEAEFEETFNICRQLDFAWIHVFPFSKREGTPAFSFKGNVMESEVTRRVELFTELAMQGKTEYVKRWLGKEVDVLMENKVQTSAVGKITARNVIFGTSQNYLKVMLVCDSKIPAAGSVVRCKLAEEGISKDFDVIAHEEK